MVKMILSMVGLAQKGNKLVRDSFLEDLFSLRTDWACL